MAIFEEEKRHISKAGNEAIRRTTFDFLNVGVKRGRLSMSSWEIIEAIRHSLCDLIFKKVIGRKC